MTHPWLTDGEYLPDFMRDFHDQKDLFKALQEVVERRNERDGALSYTKDLNWIAAHVYTVDVFLFVLARHGYTLQRSRKRLGFGDIHKFIGEAKERWQASAAKSLGLAFAAAREREARTLVTATGVSADPGGTETKPEQNLHEKGSEG